MDSPNLDAFVIRRNRHEEFYKEGSGFTPTFADATFYHSNEDALVGIAKYQLVAVSVWKVTFASASKADQQLN